MNDAEINLIIDEIENSFELPIEKRGGERDLSSSPENFGHTWYIDSKSNPGSNYSTKSPIEFTSAVEIINRLTKEDKFQIKAFFTNRGVDENGAYYLHYRRTGRGI